MRDIIGVTDIGLRSEKSVGGVFFGTGVTRALSQLEGGMPFLTTVLMRCVITGASSTAQCFKTQYGTPSNPGEVLFKAANILYTSYSQVISSQCEVVPVIMGFLAEICSGS